MTRFTPDRRADEFALPFDVVDPLGASFPEDVHAHLEDVIATIARALSDWHDGLAHEAQILITWHAANDVRLLISEITQGEGRSAARTARSIFEHLVHVHYIGLDPENLDRYVEHAAVTAQDLATIRSGSERLPTRSRKRERARLDRLAGVTRERAKKALARWPRFRTRWSDRSLFDMAELAGREEDYAIYRVLSAVTHGSAGGIHGLTRSLEGNTVYRFGADVGLVPLAFYHGLTWWLAFVDQLPPGSRTEAVASSTRALLDDYQVVVDVVEQWDRRVWPKKPTIRYTAVAAFYPDGTVRWFLNDTAERSLVLADPVDPLTPQVTAQLEDMKQCSREHRYAPVGGRPMTATFLNVKVHRRPGANPVPEGALLIPHEYMEPGKSPRKIRYDNGSFGGKDV